MGFLMICLCSHLIKSQPTIIPLSKSVKFILEDFEAKPDGVFIKEFQRISPDDNIYNCVIGKHIKNFYIDVIINQIDRDREVYKLNNMEGCIFLSNTLFNRVFHGFYENLVVNRSDPMKCPIKVGSYLFRNAFNKNALPQIHPKGNFSIDLLLKANTFDEVMLNLKWSYRLVKA
ncbi:uncharacterized protein LOC106088862 [Stomoxys calcitrans]|uniref:uncharacterized protein LOC106088862 n=1 Tax=Stomoxys calcitrans TaxID=35570 RepID=UPI0027E38AAA|nr:uncharacterized protein LOC106088862 [Stomoxys calcitrans]